MLFRLKATDSLNPSLTVTHSTCETKLATNPNPATTNRTGATVERLRLEIDECRAMVRHVEEMLQQHRRLLGSRQTR